MLADLVVVCFAHCHTITLKYCRSKKLTVAFRIDVARGVLRWMWWVASLCYNIDLFCIPANISHYSPAYAIIRQLFGHYIMLPNSQWRVFPFLTTETGGKLISFVVRVTGGRMHIFTQFLMYIFHMRIVLFYNPYCI